MVITAVILFYTTEWQYYNVMVVNYRSKSLITLPCGLYYKHTMIVNDDSSIVSKWSSKLIDDARAVIYNRNMFIIQATDFLCEKPLQL